MFFDHYKIELNLKTKQINFKIKPKIYFKNIIFRLNLKKTCCLWIRLKFKYKYLNKIINLKLKSKNIYRNIDFLYIH